MRRTYYDLSIYWSLDAILENTSNFSYELD